MTDPLVRIEVIAAADNHSRRRVSTLPPPDTLIRVHQGGGMPSKGWKLSTLRAWNPAVADRCAAILAALEKVPLKKAA